MELISEANEKVDLTIMRKFDKCIFLNRLGLVIIGIWPLKYNASKLRIIFRRIHLYVMYFCMFSILIPQWFEMYSTWGNIDANTETFMPNVFIFAVMIKYSNFLNSKQIFKDILRTMRSDWMDVMKKSNSKKNKDIMHNLSMKARDHSTKYGFIVMFTAMLYIVMPFLNTQQGTDLRDRNYPFFGRYYFDQNSDIVFGLCYLNQIISGSIVGMANFAMDSIFLVCIYHFCAQLCILQNDLMDLGSEGADSREQLISLIRRHQKEIRNAHALQIIFSVSSFQQVLVSCLMICTNGFKLIVSLNNRDVDFIMYAACMPVSLFQILFYCQPGNELIIQSQSIVTAIQQSSWVNLDRHFRRDLSFMIWRSQKPLAIIAGKIYVLSLENFMSILKTSMSALSLLRAIYKSN